MKEISVYVRAALDLGMGKLKELTAPTSLGYNDMAIMIAYGQTDEYGIPIVNSSMISDFLLNHPAVPDDARMQPKLVQGYLEVLASNALIHEQQEKGDYRMRDEVSSHLVNCAERMKSPHIEEFMFQGFRLYSAFEIRTNEEKKGF